MCNFSSPKEDSLCSSVHLHPKNTERPIYFSHPSLVIYFFATPAIKLKLGQQIGGTLLIANKPPGPIIMMSQSETQKSSQIIFIMIFSGGAQPCCAFYQPQQAMHYAEPKPFS
jgi:hypothetical protein